MVKSNEQPTQELPPIIYNEFRNNFQEVDFTKGAAGVFDIQKFLEALLGKGQTTGQILVVNASLVPAEMFINAPQDSEDQPEDSNERPIQQ